MRRAHAHRTLAFAVLAALAAFQLLGLTVALVTASRPRVGDLGMAGPGLGSHGDLVRLRARGGLPVDTVWGPGLEVGLRPGDVITRIDGVPTVEHPGLWYAARFNARPGTSYRLAVLRGDAVFETTLVARAFRQPLRWPVEPEGPSRHYMDYRVAHWWNWGPDLLLSLLMFAVGLVLGLMKRDDPVAWTFALVFLGISLATSIANNTPLLHVWPPWLALLWGLGGLAGAGYSMPLALIGLMRFPVPTRVSRGLWPWRWVPFAVFGPAAIGQMLVLFLSHSGRWSSAGLARFTVIVGHALHFALAFGFGVMGMLLAAHRLERGGQGRARLKVLWYGAMGAVVGGLWSIMIPTTFWFWITRPLGPAGAWIARFLADIAPALLVCLTPLSFAYAILARRLFGIRLVVRRGLQHLLLSRAVLAVEGVLLFLILEQTLSRGASVAGLRGPALAGGLALLVVSGIAAVNRPLMQTLDRRFFRDRYDARRVMLGLAQDLARLGERNEIVRRIGETLQAALHPSRVLIYLPGEGGTLAAAWRSDAERPGHADADEAASIGASLRAAPGRPWILLESHAGGAAPADDRDPFEDEPVEVGMAGEGQPPCCELLIPLKPARHLTGCVALAAKRSEEPYTSEDRELLVTVAHQAALALENADLLEVARREAQLAREMEIARDVQRNLFPRELPQVPGWEVAAVCRPARSVAGDYYDVLSSTDGAIGVALGDVSGKGVGASLLSAGVHAMVRSRLPQPGCDLALLLHDLNAHLLESSAAEMFVTLVVARIDPPSGRMTYVNAGHPPPLIVTPTGARWLDEGGPLAGVIPGATFVPGEVRLGPGDLLVIYSDGVTEAERPGREMFGDERLRSALVAARGGSASQALDAVLQAVAEFSGHEEPADDISVIVVRRIA